MPPGQGVTLTDTLAVTTIYYTTDGSTPTANSSSPYTNPFTVIDGETVNAIAIAAGSPASAVMSAMFTVAAPATTPTFSPNGGSLTIGQSVSLSDSVPGAAIYYTTNGSAPTASSTLYTGPIAVSASETINAIAIASGYSSSADATVSFTTIVHKFGAGLQLFSLPYDYSSSGMTPGQILLGLAASKLAVWVPSENDYQVTPIYPADQVRIGAGYWVRFAGPATVESAGAGAPDGEDFPMSLTAGWNMIGCPWTSSVALSTATVLDSVNASHSTSDAVSSGLIGGSLYAFQPGDTNYEVVSATSGTMKPYLGYWLYASQACTLNIPQPGS